MICALFEALGMTSFSVYLPEKHSVSLVVTISSLASSKMLTMQGSFITPTTPTFDPRNYVVILMVLEYSHLIYCTINSAAVSLASSKTPTNDEAS